MCWFVASVSENGDVLVVVTAVFTVVVVVVVLVAAAASVQEADRFIVGTTHKVCGTGSMKWYHVCPSVHLFVPAWPTTATNPLLQVCC